jgi:hypothetical protein
MAPLSECSRHPIVYALTTISLDTFDVPNYYLWISLMFLGNLPLLSRLSA